MKLVSISQSRYFSFQAKPKRKRPIQPFRSFNLAIEILLFSGQPEVDTATAPIVARFNLAIEILLFSGDKLGVAVSRSAGFNLAIEILLFSGTRLPCGFIRRIYAGFNLAIEILLFSGRQNNMSPTAPTAFQSRNRDTSLFRSSGCSGAPSP